MANGDQVVAEFENGRQWIRASVSQFRGRVYADIRQWYEPEPGQPMKPTQKGIAILEENLDELEGAVAALRKVLSPARKRGAA
jgi:Transcriptional Coactivator p15 (PC4)